MGITTQYLKVKQSRDSAVSLSVAFLIDSGVMYSVVPGGELLMMGIEPYREETFALSDGSKMCRPVGEAYFELDGVGATAPVIFGENHDETLLGATVLSALGLVLN